MNTQNIVSAASNVKGGDNSHFDMKDFEKLYPHFFEQAEKKRTLKLLIPSEVMNMYISFAHSCIKESRYHEGFNLCMGLFVAHFVTLYMRSVTMPDSGAAAVLQAGQLKGLMALKSVDGVSVSYDFSQTMQDLGGWAAWKSTEYGMQLATIAKMYGKGGMYIQ